MAYLREVERNLVVMGASLAVMVFHGEGHVEDLLDANSDAVEKHFGQHSSDRKWPHQSMLVDVSSWERLMMPARGFACTAVGVDRWHTKTHSTMGSMEQMTSPPTLRSVKEELAGEAMALAYCRRLTLAEVAGDVRVDAGCLQMEYVSIDWGYRRTLFAAELAHDGSH